MRSAVLTPSEISARLARISEREPNGFWLHRWKTPGEPRQASRAQVEDLLSRCVLTRDVAAVLSWLNPKWLTHETLSDGGHVFKATVPAESWRVVLDVETNPLKVKEWEDLCAELKKAVPGLLIPLDGSPVEAPTKPRQMELLPCS